MEKFKSILSTVGIVVVMIAIYVGWSNYKLHQAHQRMQRQLQMEQSMPKGGVVVDENGTMRWQD